ncbi:hypothetical protein KGM_213634 [Danaus plexippus plexippus]|uniref:Uncharacterized protein n=1 Tax=Danaus plexippus plexippus TaxID=278856 RepID=A0A212F864_DANPL|nr:hypothetical protein KGM_213634 [Danaus plexippus plexippus]
MFINSTIDEDKNELRSQFINMYCEVGQLARPLR